MEKVRDKSVPEGSPLAITPRQTEILKLLFDFKCLDTTAIHNRINYGHSLQATIGILTRLKAAGLVSRHRQPPGPALYNLTKAGATAIGVEVKSQHCRRPSRSTLSQRQAQLQLEEAAGQRGLVIYRATPSSPFSRVSARQSEVRQLITQHYIEVERARLEKPQARQSLDFYSRVQNLEARITPVPGIFREYYLHPPGKPGIIVILSGAKTDRRFWQKKTEELGGLCSHLPVVGLFRQKPPEELLQMIKKAGFMAVLLERFGPFLDKYLPLVEQRPGLVTSEVGKIE